MTRPRNRGADLEDARQGHLVQTPVPSVAGNLTSRYGKGVNTTMDDGAMVVEAPTLTAANNPSRSPQSAEVTAQVAAARAAGAGVRRLTPVECERLQGFPDGWTIPDETPWQEHPGPDGPRYAQMGNAVTVPVIEWIGRRIMEVEQRCEE